MARRTRTTAPTEEPTAEAVAEATAAETGPETVSNEEIMRRIQEEFANRPEPRRVTIGELYEQGIALIASAMGYRTARVKSEQTAIRLYELTLMWALNNRGGTPSHDILPDLPQGDGEGSEGDTELPTPDEIIEAAPNAADEE